MHPPTLPRPGAALWGACGCGGNCTLHCTATEYCTLCTVYCTYSVQQTLQCILQQYSTSQASSAPVLPPCLPPHGASGHKACCSNWGICVRSAGYGGGDIKEDRLAVQNHPRSMGIQALVKEQGDIGLEWRP